MSSRRESGAGFSVPLRMRRQFTSLTTPSPTQTIVPTPPPGKISQEDSDEDDCCIIVPEIKRQPAHEIADDEGPSTSTSGSHERSRSFGDSKNDRRTAVQMATPKSEKQFQMSEALSISERIRRNLQFLRQGKEKEASPVPKPSAKDDSDDEIGSMSVTELIKKAKTMTSITNENKNLKSKLKNAEGQLKGVQSQLNQKEGLVTQYETEIETMTELLKDAENELDKAHKERMMKGHSSEEVNKLNQLLQSQKEAQRVQDKATSELQKQLKARQAEIKSLKTSFLNVTDGSNRGEKDLAKKSQEIVKLKQALKEAQEACNKEKEETKHAKDAEKVVKSELLYKCSVLATKSEKLIKEEKETVCLREKMKESEQIRRKSLDVTNLCYSTIGAMAKELNRCKDIGRSLSDLLQDIQVKFVERQVTKITEGDSISTDENIKEILNKIWSVQKKFRPVILIDMKEDDVGNIRTQVTEAPIAPTNGGRGRGRGKRGRPRGGNFGHKVALPTAPAITNLPADLTEFEQKTQQNNKLLLQCLDLLAAAHCKVSSKETLLAGMTKELSTVRKDLQNKDDCYTIHVYEQGREKSAGADSGGDGVTGVTAFDRVVTSVAAVPRLLDSTEKPRRPSSNITVIQDDDMDQDDMNVRMECESDGEIDGGMRTLGIQTSPFKDHVLVLIDSDEENAVEISDSEDDNAETNKINRSIGTSARKTTSTAVVNVAKDSNPNSPVKAVLTNVTTIPQSLFDEIEGTDDDAEVADNDTVGADDDTGGTDNDTEVADNDTVGADNDTGGTDDDAEVADNDTVGADNDAGGTDNDAEVADNDTVGANDDVGDTDDDAEVADNDTVGADNDVGGTDDDAEVADNDTVGADNDAGDTDNDAEVADEPTSQSMPSDGGNEIRKSPNLPEFNMDDFEDFPNSTKEDKLKALQLIQEIESKVVDFRHGPPLNRYSPQQIKMTGLMLRKKKIVFKPRSDGSDGEGTAKGGMEGQGKTSERTTKGSLNGGPNGKSASENNGETMQDSGTEKGDTERVADQSKTCSTSAEHNQNDAKSDTKVSPSGKKVSGKKLLVSDDKHCDEVENIDLFDFDDAKDGNKKTRGRKKKRKYSEEDDSGLMLKRKRNGE